MPEVAGVDSKGTESGDVAKDFLRYGGGIKKDFHDKWSAALIVDEPHGADLFYEPESLAFGATLADIHSTELTGLVRYKLSPRLSVHDGLRVGRRRRLGGVGLRAALGLHLRGRRRLELLLRRGRGLREFRRRRSGWR